MFIKKHTLSAVFIIPLIERESFEISKVYAIPLIENNVGNYLEVSNNFIVLDSKHERMLEIEKADLEKNCRKIKSQFYCDKLNSLSKTQNSQIF